MLQKKSNKKTHEPSITHLVQISNIPPKFPPAKLTYSVLRLWASQVKAQSGHSDTTRMSLEQENYGGANPLLTPGSVLDLNKGVIEDIDEKELGVENDKANDKLVDLVSLLTNKINKNVKEIQVDIIDHYENTNKKFDDLENKGFERVRDLTQKVEERKEANRILRLKIIELQKKQKAILEKYDTLDIEIGQFKEHHENVTENMESHLKKHGNLLVGFEKKETK